MSLIIEFQIKPNSHTEQQLHVIERGVAKPLCVESVKLDELLIRWLERDAESHLDPKQSLNALREIGNDLYKTLFTAQVKKIWQDYRAENHYLILCIRITTVVDKLEQLPWEALHDGKSFLSSQDHLTITRLPTDVPVLRTLSPVEIPFKVLASIPETKKFPAQYQLDAREEQEYILLATDEAICSDKLRIDFDAECSLAALEDCFAQQHHIFHFLGHGGNGEDDGLMLPGSDGHMTHATTSFILQAMERLNQKLRVIILTGTQARTTYYINQFHLVGRSLIRRQIPLVITVQASMQDQTSVYMINQLYRALSENADISVTIGNLRRDLLADSDPVMQKDALAPVVYLTSDHPLPPTSPSPGKRADSLKEILLDTPIPITPVKYFGRQVMVRHLRKVIKNDERRILLIHGPEGSGKTAFALQVATAMKHEFKAFALVNCRSTTISSERIVYQLHQVLESVGISDMKWTLRRSVKPEKLGARLAQALNKTKMMVVLDSCESLLEERDGEYHLADPYLQEFLQTLLMALQKPNTIVVTSTEFFHTVDKKTGLVQPVPLGSLDRPETLGLMQNLPRLNKLPFDEKLNIYNQYMGNPLSLVLLDLLMKQTSYTELLEQQKQIEPVSPIKRILQMATDMLTAQARRLLNQLAVFQSPVEVGAVTWLLENDSAESKKVLAVEETTPATDSSSASQIDQALLDIFQSAGTSTGHRTEKAALLTELESLGLIICFRKQGEIYAITLPSVVRSYCQEGAEAKTWVQLASSAATYYHESANQKPNEPKTKQEIFLEVEAIATWCNAGDYQSASQAVLDLTTHVGKWGMDWVLESLHYRLMKNVDLLTRNRLHLNLGKLLQFRGDYKQALDHLIQAKNMASQHGAAVVEGEALLMMALVHRDLEEFQAAREYCEQAQEIFSSEQNYRGAAEAARLSGMILRDTKQFKPAWVSFEQAMKYYADIDDQEGTASVMFEIGLYHQINGEIDAAMAHYNPAMEIYRDNRNKHGVANIHHQIGTVKQDLNQPGKALKCFEKAKSILDDIGEYAGLARTQFQIGLLHLDNKEYIKANLAIEAARQMYSEMDNKAGVARTAHHLGILYRDTGGAKVAKDRFEEAIKLRLELNDLVNLADSHRQLGKLELDTNQFQLAFNHYLEAMMYLVQVQSPVANELIPVMNRLRHTWGKNHFDQSWEEKTGRPVPDQFKDEGD